MKLKSESPEKAELVRDFAAKQAEQTLRLLARVTPPASLEERIHARLLAQQSIELSGTSTKTGRGSSWFSGLHRSFLTGNLPGYGVAAAALLCVVAGAAYYGAHPRGHFAAPLHPGATPTVTGQSGSASSSPLLAPPQIVPRGSFGSAGSMRVPPTLKPLYVAEAPHGKRTTKPTHKTKSEPAAKDVSTPAKP